MAASQGVRTRWKYTEAEISAIAEYLEAGRSDEWIARKLGCTVTALRLVRKRRGLAPRTELLLSARRIQVLLGIGCAKTVTRWIEAGHLRGRRGQRRGPNRQWYVAEDALLRFLGDPAHWHRWDPARIAEEGLREWATEIRRGVRFLTPGEVADRCFVNHAAVNDWINRGVLPAVRNGNWWVRECDLVGFVPPGQRSKRGRPRRRFTPGEDVTIYRMRQAGVSWVNIARELRCRAELVRDRHAKIAADGADWLAA